MSPSPKKIRRSESAIDEPLTAPGSDLLEMDQHARALAEYIQQSRKLPFTVGIFGEWGEGKTTMVNFLKHHLAPKPLIGPRTPFNFVSFSAWPYTTSEKLWRALILEIAKVLYRVDSPMQEADELEAVQANDESGPATAVSESENGAVGLMDRIVGFLNDELFKPKEKPVELDRFEKLVKELDRTDYGKISKRTPNSNLDQEAVVSAVVNGALGALGTVSPLVSSIRSFLSWDKLNPDQKDDTAEEGAASEEVEALPRFQRIFREILSQKLGNQPVYVFIDDLDRAQPDVALDIMESIRIALAEGDCVYILAVDERLIAQGLKIRYRELFEKEKEVEIATKGQEYLEKIIQFRTRVPPRTPEQTQRLIAAEFPHWTPAGDIIQGIVGNNPRRVKQYCQRLSFQNMIGLTTFTLGSAPEAEIPETSSQSLDPQVADPPESTSKVQDGPAK